MVFFISVFIGFLGLFIGSFLGVVIDRLPKEESIIISRSHCSHCKKIIPWYDLIPLLSFIFLQGKCRFCHVTIGLKLFFIEFITGATFFSTSWVILPHRSFLDFSFLSYIHLFYALYIICVFLIIFFIDKKYHIIPNKLIYPAIGVSLLYLMVFNSQLLVLNFISGLGAFSFFFFLFAITKGRGMGFGDVKFVFLLGLFLGFPGIVIALYVAFLTGAISACILIIAGKKKFHGSTIAFGPFLILGGLFSFYLGTLIENIFYHFFL